MDNLVQKLNWDMPFIKNQCMFVYADADLDSNQKMQEPLQKLYQYENQPDICPQLKNIDKVQQRLNDYCMQMNMYAAQGVMVLANEVLSMMKQLKEDLNEAGDKY